MLRRRWIKNQCNYKLIELQGSVSILSVAKRNDNGVFEIKFNIVCNGFVVGIYSSYERCQEILDEILAFILSKEKYIFEMPKE